MTADEVKEILLKELPTLIHSNLEVRATFFDVFSKHFVEKSDFEKKFDALLEKLDRFSDDVKKAREEDRKEWQKELRDSEARWQKELQDSREEWDKKFKQSQEEWDKKFKQSQEEWDKKFKQSQEEWDRRFEKSREEWKEEFKKSLDESRGQYDDAMAAFKLQDQKLDSTIKAIGARWGKHSEASFRAALKGILEKHFDVEVVSVTEFDSSGEVFGKPDTVEIDIIIRNGLLIICEIKSSMHKGDIYLFYKKAKYYEKTHNKKISEMIAISPLMLREAVVTARKLGVKTYRHVEDVKEFKESIE